MLFTIKKLPLELQYYIYNYIDIDTRIEFMTHVFNKHTFLEYIDAIPTEKNVQLFKIFIMNQLLMYKQRSSSDYSLWFMKPSISKLVPVIKYKINGRQHVLRNEIYNLIIRHANIEFIPRRFNNYTPHGLERKRQQYIKEHASNVYSVFSTLECGFNHSKFKYVIKKILLYYMISIIMYGKELYMQKIIQKKHAEIKYWMKRALPKPLKVAVKKYEQRVKKRLLEQAKGKANREKQKSTEKIKTNNPKVVIIKRKRVSNPLKN